MTGPGGDRDARDAPASLGAVRIAIVDDHRMFLDGLQRSLADTPSLRVVAAVPSWPQLVRHPAYPVDVVVLDLELKDGVPPAVKISSARAAGVATGCTVIRVAWAVPGTVPRTVPPGSAVVKSCEVVPRPGLEPG